MHQSARCFAESGPDSGVMRISERLAPGEVSRCEFVDCRLLTGGRRLYRADATDHVQEPLLAPREVPLKGVIEAAVGTAA